MSYRTWMGDLPERVTKVPLGHLAIPGSHNSFSSRLDASMGVAVDQGELVRKIGNSCCGIARNIIKRWSVNQSIGMVEQLNDGIRYFDLRVGKRPDTDKFHFLHGLYGEEVNNSLKGVKAFFQENPSEVAILDMNHFYNMEPADHDRLLGEIMENVGDMLVPVNGYQYKLWSLTLDSIWNKSGRIILIYHNPFNASQFPNIWNKTVISSPWPNTSSKEALITFLESYYTEGKRLPGYAFHVWQGCLTPTGATIAKCVFRSLKDLARPATGAYIKWLKDKSPGEQKINICLVDFVEMSDFIPEVIALNRLPFDVTEDLYAVVHK